MNHFKDFKQHEGKFGSAQASVIPSDADKAYAAGFFDGEGNVCIGKNARAGKSRNYSTYNMRVGASQKEPETLFWMRDRWGGSVTESVRKTPRGVVTYYVWGSFSRGAERFLVDLLPHLQVKKERAQLALKFQGRIVQRGRRGQPEGETDERALMKLEMNKLNGMKQIVSAAQQGTTP